MMWVPGSNGASAPWSRCPASLAPALLVETGIRRERERKPEHLERRSARRTPRRAPSQRRRSRGDPRRSATHDDRRQEPGAQTPIRSPRRRKTTGPVRSALTREPRSADDRRQRHRPETPARPTTSRRAAALRSAERERAVAAAPRAARRNSAKPPGEDRLTDLVAPAPPGRKQPRRIEVDHPDDGAQVPLRRGAATVRSRISSVEPASPNTPISRGARASNPNLTKPQAATTPGASSAIILPVSTRHRRAGGL